MLMLPLMLGTDTTVTAVPTDTTVILMLTDTVDTTVIVGGNFSKMYLGESSLISSSFAQNHHH